jgi:hypothetical protein
MTGGIIGGTESDHANLSFNGGGVHNSGKDSLFTMSGNAVISGNKAEYHAGGVFNYATYFSTHATFEMSGNAAITGNTSGDYAGGVWNGDSLFTMNGGVISGNTATNYGGGIVNLDSSEFTMNGGEVSGNSTGIYGGGIFNLFGYEFTINDGKISDNTAARGGGVANYEGIFTMTGGEISGNKATGANANGSGGGIYTTDFSQLKVAAGVVFSGNTAPTLRIQDIAGDADIDGNGVADVTDYAKIGKVVLSEFILSALSGKNAPAYNNYDINYPDPNGVYAVYVDMDLDGAGSVTAKNTSGETVYGTLTKNGHVLVPISAASVTFSADAGEGYVFLKFVIDGTDFENDSAVSVTGNMNVTAQFVSESSPAPPVSGSYTIVSSAGDGASISPVGNISVSAGGNMTFAFSARSGYEISAVYADGSSVSSEALASGTYTFYNVQSNHTIEATGTPSSAPPDSGSEGDGLESGERTTGGAVLNLVFALIAIAAGIVAVVAGRNRSEKKDSNERKSKRFIPKIVSLILGTVSVIVFLVTGDMSLTAAVADNWTVLMFILVIATLISAFVSFRYREEGENPEDGNADT